MEELGIQVAQEFIGPLRTREGVHERWEALRGEHAQAALGTGGGQKSGIPLGQEILAFIGEEKDGDARPAVEGPVLDGLLGEVLPQDRCVITQLAVVPDARQIDHDHLALVKKIRADVGMRLGKEHGKRFPQKSRDELRHGKANAALGVGRITREFPFEVGSGHGHGCALVASPVDEFQAVTFSFGLRLGNVGMGG